jgi:hypothetical protein
VIRNRTERIARYILYLIDGGGLMEKKALRNVNNRRSGKDRRMFNYSDYKGPEHRSGEDRRFLGDRRSSMDCQTILTDFLRIN